MTQRLCLTPLSLDDIVALVCQRLGVTALPVPVIDVIYEKAAGHPLFSEELAYALRDAGAIRVTEGMCRCVPDVGDFRSLPFPGTLDGVITSRFDRLPLAPQLLLKVASVIGAVAPCVLLQAINPIAMEVTPMTDMLTALQQVGFLLPEHTGTEGTYRFRHMLTHEVVYNLLSLAQRRALHRVIAEWYETTYAGLTNEVLELLTYHFGKSAQDEKAVDYAMLTAEKAQQRWAYTETLAHLEAALKRLALMPDTVSNRLRRIDAVLKQGEVKFALGRHVEHLEALNGIHPLVEEAADPRRRATWYYWMGFL